MKMIEFVTDLKTKGIELRLEGDQLRVRSKHKGALTPELRIRIRNHKPALIEFFHRAAHLRAEPNRRTIEPAPADAVKPLSFGQERLWFIEQLEPGNAVYLMPEHFRIRSPLALSFLVEAVNKVMNHQECFRQAFLENDGKPILEIQDQVQLPFKVVDLSGLEEDEREPLAVQLAGQHGSLPFDLRKAPLFRMLALRLGPDDHGLSLNTHHIISDGWSQGVFRAGWRACYEQRLRQQPLTLPDQKLSYSDFAYWQRQRLAETGLEGQLSYWSKKLADLEPLAFPTDRPRGKRQTFAGSSMNLAFSEELVSSLRRLAREEQATLFQVFLATFKILLARYSGQGDVTIGSSIGNRNDAQLEGIVGLFVNLLTMRTRLQDNPTFREVLEQVKQSTLEAYANADVPFEKVVDAVQPARDRSRHPLFQIQFIFNSTPAGGSRENGVDLLPFESLITGASQVSRVDFSIGLADQGGPIFGNIEFNTDLFDEQSMRRLARHWHILLDAVLDNPHCRIQQFPMLSEAERTAIAARNNKLASYASQESLVSQFELQVRANSRAPALSIEGESMDYGTLNQRANQVARLLRQHGIGSESHVGLCMLPSEDLMVCLLAILKAGAAYVPIDPKVPVERMRFILEDAQISLLLAHEPVADELDKLAITAPCLWVDRLSETLASMDANNLDLPIDSNQAAYLIYTSGSTGKPKGVVIPHQNVLRLFDACDPWYEFGPEDVWTLFHSFAFDFSVWEIWGAWLYGGRLVAVPYWVSRSPEAFFQLLAREDVTILNQTPSAFQQLVRYVEDEKPEQELSLRRVIFGGEALQFSSLKSWFDRFGDTQPHLINMYGITETTVHVTHRPVKAVDLNTHGSLIGSRIPDLEMHLFDGKLEPVPIGVTGELCIGGAGIARGYWCRPGLTAQRFVPNPSGDGTRLYRSGDLAKYRNDGELEYLGRLDAQVKIRGFRIELGDIEHALLAHPTVVETLVLTRVTGESGPRLVAYVRLQEGEDQAESGQKLRAFLQEKLPDYMVPAAWVFLDAFPLTGNGKIDRKALPEPEVIAGTFEEPTTGHEQRMAAIWSELLGLERVGVTANFFELGGDSLISIQVKARAKKQGLDFELHQLFEYPTIRGLLAVSNEATEDHSEFRVEPFSQISKEDRERMPDGVGDAYPLSYMQFGMFYHSQLESDSLDYHDIMTYGLKAEFNEAMLRRSLDVMSQRHDILRTGFELHRFSGPLQLVYERKSIPLGVIDLRDDPDLQGAFERYFQAEKRDLFDLAEAPLLRFKVFRVSEDHLQILFTMHHAIMDGWSEALFFTEWVNTYQALCEGGEPNHPPMDARYAAYIAAEQKTLKDPATLAFWDQNLGDFAATPVPTMPRELFSSYDAEQGVYPSTFDEDVLDPLEALATRCGVPLKSVLLAAHMKVLSLVTGRRDVVAGLAFNGRPEAEGADRMLGLFLNSLPFRVKLGDGNWLELIKDVFEREKAILPHRRYPMPELIKQHGGHELFDHLFNYTHFHAYKHLEQESDEESLLQGKTGFTKNSMPLIVNIQLFYGTRILGLQLDYDLERFRPEQIVRLSGYYKAVLSAMVREPEEDHLSCDPRSDEEKTRWLAYQQSSNIAVPPHDLVSCFAKKVGQRGTEIALETAQGSLTFAALDRASNAWARLMMAHNLRTDDLVGVCVQPGPRLVEVILAIVKSGAAYLPIDPDYPAERIAVMLADAKPKLMVVDKDEVDWIPGDCAVLRSDVNLENGDESLPLPPTIDSGDRLAYVTYTSGSTGKPKGVAVTHRNVLRLVFDDQYLAIKPGDGVAQVSNVSFDAFTFEMWTALLHGGRLCSIDRDEYLDLARLEQRLKQWQVRTMFVTTAMFNQIARQRPTIFQGLRDLLFGGERVDLDAVRSCMASEGPERLLHVYGPTETTTFALWHLVNEVSERADNLPIGQPIAHSSGYVVDGTMRPVPEGTPGELLLGGLGVSRGYLGKPAQTAAVFVPNPFASADEAGSRLYRSGDVVRYRPDGPIEFIGREDHQVKLRGFRIEPDEIAHHLRLHETVNDALVLVMGTGSDEKRLVAYVVPVGGRTDQEQDSAALQESWEGHLGVSLPSFMIPSAFVMLPRFPLNKNGKIDRSALPEPEWTADLQTYEAPLNQREELLCALWSAILGLERCGRHDRFFELGGHSLLATQLVSRVRHAFGVDMPIKVLFEYPTPAGLAEAIEAMGQENRALLPAIEARDQMTEAPLSYSQERLWFIHQFDPDGATYNVPVSLTLAAPVHEEALRRALDEMVNRHHLLRSRFISRDGDPLQIVDEASGCSWVTETLGDLEPSQRQQRLHELLQIAAHQPFSLEDGPLMRASFFDLGEIGAHLLVSFHHIIFDGWSVKVFTHELFSLYEAFIKNEPSPLPALELQFGDYAAWQRQWLQGEALASQFAYWEERLKDGNNHLEMPTDRPRPAQQTSNGQLHRFSLEPRIAEELQQLCRREGVTPFMALLAAFSAFLAKTCQQVDLNIGTVVAGRDRPEIESLIGFFVNTLVLRLDLSDDPDYQTLLARARTCSLDAFAHGELPFEQLVEHLQPTRDMSRSPLFQVMFSIETETAPEAYETEMNLAAEIGAELELSVAKFDLNLTMICSDRSLRGELEYNTDLYDPATVARFMDHYSVLITNWLAQPQAPLSKVPMISPTERGRLVKNLNPAVPYEVDSFPEAFVKHARQRPHDIAMVMDDRSMTFQALNEACNRVAHGLIARGVGPESRVGICLHKGFDLIIALVGTLKSGAAYVPLDPDYPADRLQYMIDDAGLAWVLADPAVESAARDDRWLSLEECAADKGTVDNPTVTIDRDNLAYVIYTSGSTGKPKGVGVTQGCLLAYSSGACDDYNLGAEDHFLQFCSINFDVSVEEIFTTLFAGARLILHKGPQQLSFEEWVDYCGAHGVSMVSLPTAYWHELSQTVTTPLADRMPRLRMMIVGGEKADTSRLVQWQKLAPNVTWLNSYGPTETTVACSYFALGEGDPIWDIDQSIPIGSPMPSYQLLVVDSYLRLSGQGVPGELVISGPCVTRGYLGKPARTAQVFLPNPFSEEPGQRLYRTGDRVLLDEAMQIIFLGRVDDQVKIRGFRIEPGEVSQRLVALEAVEAAYVCALSDPAGQTRLVAYFVPVAEEFDAVALREALLASLPEYMIPALFIPLPVLPIATIGKIDRRALPKPNWDMVTARSEYVAPETETQTAIVTVWQEVLGLVQVGIQDHFFELGGHSLLMAKVVGRLREILNIEVPMRALFEYPVLTDLAGYIDITLWSEQSRDHLSMDVEDEMEEDEI